jgi:hypothetical protein
MQAYRMKQEDPDSVACERSVIGHYRQIPNLKSAFPGISVEAGIEPSGTPYNCTRSAHAIINPPSTISPGEAECIRDGRRLSSEMLACARGRYDGVSGFGMRTSRQTSTSRPGSGWTGDSTALRSLIEDIDEDRDGVLFSLWGGLNEVGGGEVAQKWRRRMGESGG